MRARVGFLHGHEADQTTVAQLLHKNTYKVKNKASFGVFLDDFLVGSPLNANISL